MANITVSEQVIKASNEDPAKWLIDSADRASLRLVAARRRLGKAPDPSWDADLADAQSRWQNVRSKYPPGLRTAAAVADMKKVLSTEPSFHSLDFRRQKADGGITAKTHEVAAAKAADRAVKHAKDSELALYINNLFDAATHQALKDQALHEHAHSSHKAKVTGGMPVPVPVVPPSVKLPADIEVRGHAKAALIAKLRAEKAKAASMAAAELAKAKDGAEQQAQAYKAMLADALAKQAASGQTYSTQAAQDIAAATDQPAPPTPPEPHSDTAPGEEPESFDFEKWVKENPYTAGAGALGLVLFTAALSRR